MNIIDSILARIDAEQDQQIEHAKDWLGRDNIDALQFVALWAHLNKAFADPKDEIASQFALIGLVHVVRLLQDAQSKEAAE